MPHDEVLQQEPTEKVAGDTWKWERRIPEHTPADGWTLSYAFIGPSSLTFNAAASGDNQYFVIVVAATDSASLKPGSYRWSAYLTKGAERFTFAEGQLLVHANLATTAPAESHAAKMVTALETAIHELVTKKAAQVTINGRSVTRLELRELRRQLGHYRAELYRERHGRIGPRVEEHFVAP